MEHIGKNVERLQELIQTPVKPPPSWIQSWQAEAEHVLHLANKSKDTNDLEELKRLDTEAERVIKDREGFVENNWRCLGNGIYRQVYKVKCDRLMGARAQFEVNELQSFYATDGVGKLYFWDASSMKGLQVLPFITVEESTKHKQKACYIFSKTKNNDTARFVSYHNDIEPEYSPTTSELLGPIFQRIENNGE